MNSTIRTSVPKAKEVKTLNAINTKHLKTKVNLEIRTDGDTQPAADWIADLAEDIKALDAGNQPLSKLEWSVEGAPAIGRLVNRSVNALAKIGLELSTLEWEDGSGVVTVGGDLGYGSNLPHLAELLFRMADRASSKMGHTHHPLTTYDLKQAIGLVYDLRQGNGKDLDEWFGVRELTILEETKAAKAKAAKAAKAAKGKKADPTKPKSKPKPKAEGEAANLTDLAE